MILISFKNIRFLNLIKLVQRIRILDIYFLIATIVMIAFYIEGFCIVEQKKRNNKSLGVNQCVCEMTRVVNECSREKIL